VPHIVVGVLVAAGIGASLAVIPRDRELALMYLLGDDLEAAQAALEARLANGDLSPGVVAPLARVYLEIGDFEGAIALMESHAARHPEDADTKQELAKLYRQTSRLYDYVETLADLAKIRPTEPTLRELSWHYGDHGEDAKQVEVLRALVKLPKATLEDWMDLAEVEAGLDNFEGATQALVGLQRRFNVPRNQRNVEFFVSVLARTGREADALALARDWLAGASGPAGTLAVMGVVRQFLGAGKDAAALGLIEQLPQSVLESSLVFASRVRIEISLGRRDIAFQRLREAYARGTLPVDFEDDLVDLALERNLTSLAVEVALLGRPTRLPEWQIVSVIGIAPESRLSDVARWALSAGEILERRPALGAIVLKAVGQTARALQMAERALADPSDLSPDQILGLILLLADLNKPDAARMHLGRLIDRHGLP
jgi:tetratricopeptide (TPR) repeat protein